MAESEIEYIPTGVDGLDNVLCGGFLRSGFYLLQGNPSSGKTTLALQFLLKSARRGERGLYISLTESHNDLARTCRSHGWDIADIEIADLTRSDANLAMPEERFLTTHLHELRELKITTSGVQVGEPLVGFRGVMTGVPEYKGQTQGLSGKGKTE